jgi:DNA replication protein DnaD
MEELVKYIYDTISVCYGYDEMFISNINSNENISDEVDRFEEKFSEVMETCAIDMNMRYYEDISDGEYNELVIK